MNRQFVGKIALVTGGGSGIGRASALAFGREGAKVIVVDSNIPDGEETVRIVKKGNGEAIFIKADVSDEFEVRTMINKAMAIYHRLDLAHNNADVIGGMADTAEFTGELWDHMINVNAKAVWVCMKFEISQMPSVPIIVRHRPHEKLL